MPSDLGTTIVEHVRAAFSGLWVRTHEPFEAMEEINAAAHLGKGWDVAVWDIDAGWQNPNGKTAEVADDPVKAIRLLGRAAGTALLILPNFAAFLKSPDVVQAVANQVQAGKQRQQFIVIISPVVEIPPELEKAFVVIDHDLPDREQLEDIAVHIAEGSEIPPAGPEREQLLDAAAGLTRFEAEGAFALSIVRHGKLDTRTIWELKAAQLKKSGLLGLHYGGEKFDDLGGLDALKTFTRKALAGAGERVARPRGILMLGVPGTGKSAFAKALGNETNRPTLILDVGAMMGSLVGQSEANMRAALRIADAMAPCILFVDEVEKALSGVASSGQTDSGVTARVFGTLLTWLSDHQSDVFFVGTCNDISKLPPEFSRAERFDGIFFLDLPDADERDRIWQIHIDHFELNMCLTRPVDRDWTGAEIRSCCRLASLLGVSLTEAAANVVPVAVTASESVARLRSWASGRCLDATTPGIYSQSRGTTETTNVRRVARK